MCLQAHREIGNWRDPFTRGDAAEAPDEVVTVAPDATELPLSLDQCRAMVLQNNLALKVVRFDPEIAEEGVIVARAVFEPLVFAGFDFF